MGVSLYLPLIFSIIFLLLCLPIITLIPDTRPADPNDDQPSAPTMIDERVENAPSVSNDSQIIHAKLHTSSRGLLDNFRNRNMVLAMQVFLVGLLRPSTLNVLIQYTSIKFEWKLSAAVILVSEVAAINLMLFLLVLPQVMGLLQHGFHLHPQKIDLAVVRFSMLYLSVGALLLGLAPSVPTLILGKHAGHLLRRV